VRAMPAGARLQVMQQLATQDLRAESESKRRRPTATTAVAGGGKFADMSSHLAAGAMAGAKAVPNLVRRVGHHGAPAVQEGETGAWLVPLFISKADAYARRYENVVCAVSHRWEEPNQPDPEGAQFVALQAYLKEHPKIEYVFYDFSCVAQGSDCGVERTPAQKETFKRQLANVNLLYLGASVLILMDASYLSRFWTQFEAYLSMKTVQFDPRTNAQAIAPAARHEKRWTTKCIHNASAEFEGKHVEHKWWRADQDMAMLILERPDTIVTNAKDKKVQLERLESEFSRITFRPVSKETSSFPRRRASSQEAIGEPASPQERKSRGMWSGISGAAKANSGRNSGQLSVKV